MPVYDYDCIYCGAFEAVRRIAERDYALPCPRCAAPAERVRVGAPSIAGGSTSSNEGEGGYGMRHLGSCSCCP